jgi:hypothetical protein
MNDETSPERTFVYDAEPRKRAWERKLAGFVGLVLKASEGKPDPLVDYFRDGGPRQLSEDDCEWLGWLLAEELPRNGRPPGSLTPRNEAIQFAGYLVQTGKGAWCRKHGRDRAPGPNKAPTDKIIKRAIA